MATAETENQAKKQRDLIARLADRGEDALHRLGDIPGGSRAVKAFNDLKARVDEMGKKVRGIDALEARVAKLEKDVSSLKRSAKAPGSKQPSAPRKPAA
jgi:hypothetical protein